MASVQNPSPALSDSQLLDALVVMSREFGSDPQCVLAGGGNTSVKIGDRLLVKASGYALATIPADGFVALDRKALDQILETDFGADPDAREENFKQALMATRYEPEKGQRPSVESLMHHMAPGRFVLHAHPTVVNALTCCRDGAALAHEIFGDAILWVSYVDPGLTIAQAMWSAMCEHKVRTGMNAPRAILMQNHGVMVYGETPEAIRETLMWLTDAIDERLRQCSDQTPFGPVSQISSDHRRHLINVISPVLRGLLSEDSQPLKIVTCDDSLDAVRLTCGARGHAIATGGPLTPDQIVYCKSFPMWFEPADDENVVVDDLKTAIERHIAETHFPPKVILVKGVGALFAGRDIQDACNVRDVYLDAVRIMAGAQCLGGIAYMGKREREFIDAWEVENYRRQIAAIGAAAGRAAGKVAMVTGAAQGFGLEIAQDLAAQGAHVVLFDVNEEGAVSAARALEKKYGQGRAVGLGGDIRDGASVAEAVHQVIRRFGGIDLLISNAGVLRAESVKTQSEQDFDLVTDVNYKGYFLCVQNVAPIMARQRRARPDRWFDIIQINSKSGLHGSNRNGAYAGSKFGGIGLTQSFALELVEDGIKVNAICPGNFFDGPLWSDPENGLFVQYLRTNKVPGAKTIDDVRRAYESKVPMGRGCQTADVMKAIYYLMEQEYETGQALPVTGGQAMLS